MTVDTPNGPAVIETATKAKDGSVLFVARHKNGATWMYFAGEIEPRTAADANALDAFIGLCQIAHEEGRALPALR